MAAAVTTCWPANATGVEPGPIVKIQEDWTVEIGVPNPCEDSPQIVTVFSPTGSLDDAHAVFELNHATLPEYGAGGMQLQTWDGQENRDHRNFPNIKTLNTDNEIITFTVMMSLEGDQLKFEVLDGHSTTWGNFGGQGYLKSTQTTDLTHLSSYDPDTSVNHSRVGFASHRVKKFARNQVRFYTVDGLLATDSTERVVHAYSGGDQP